MKPASNMMAVFRNTRKKDHPLLSAHQARIVSGRLPIQTILLAIFTLLLSACTALEKTEQPHINYWIAIEPGSSFGQTFTARYDGLESVSIYLQPLDLGQGSLVMHLLPGPGENLTLATASLAFSEITEPGYYSFQFQVQPASNQQYYYLQIEMQGHGQLQVGISGGDTYLNGAFYQNDLPQNAQLSFRLGYAPLQMTAGLLSEGLHWLAFLVVGFFLYIIPGWALLSWLWTEWRHLHWVEKFGLSAGVSLALYPILLLWTNLIGLHLGALYAWLPAGIGLLSLILRFAFDFPRFSHRDSSLLSPKNFFGVIQKIDHKVLWPNLILVGMIGLIFITRFWAIRSLEAPMWGDSYQHTVIAQLIVDNKGLFTSWQPYAEMTSFTYHFGFHSLAAIFHWMTGLPMHQSVLWTGQIINSLAVLSLLPLAMRLRRNLWTGVIVLLLAGFLAPMPMYYINWGRYTQLAGQVILPVLVTLHWHSLQSTSESKALRGQIFLGGLLLAGLGLTHYRVLVFAFCSAPALLLVFGDRTKIHKQFHQLIWMSLFAALLFLPWFANLFSGRLWTVLGIYTTIPAKQTSEFIQTANSITDLSAFLHPSLWLAMVIAAAWGLWQRQREIAVVGLWWLFIVIVTNPNWLNLPGQGAITNFAVAIAAYIPASLMIGSVAGGLFDLVMTRKPIAALNISLAMFLLVAGIFGARQRQWDVQPFRHTLVTRPDLHAAEWIAANLPENSRLLVYSFFAYNSGAIAGSDAGWWLPLLASRQTTLPPLLYTTESAPIPDYILYINSLSALILEYGLQDTQVLEALRQRQVTHIYIGQLQGRVNNNRPLIDLELLSASPDYIPVYHRDRVWIFQLLEPKP